MTHATIMVSSLGTTGVSWALLVYMQNCQPTLLVLIDRKVKLAEMLQVPKPQVQVQVQVQVLGPQVQVQVQVLKSNYQVQPK